MTMSESKSAPKPKRRRRWLLALVPLVLVGYAWWRMGQPQPLPKFLEPFKDQVVRHNTSRVFLMSDKYYEVTSIYIDSPYEKVVVPLKQQVGSEPILPTDGVEWVIIMANGVEGIYLHGAVFNGKRGTVVSVVGGIKKWALLDSAIAGVWPNWLGMRYGHHEWGPMRNFSAGEDSSYSRERLQEMLTTLR